MSAGMGREAFIVDAIRTPIGRRNGSLATVHPADLLAHVITELLARTGVNPLAIDDVIAGCLEQVGPQAGNIARTAWLSAGLPEAVPGTTVDRQCGSSQQSIHFAAQAVAAGTQDLVLAVGVQNMSMVPIFGGALAGAHFGVPADPFTGSVGWAARYGDEEISQFRGAEIVAQRWQISREDMEQYSVESHERALLAQKESRFDPEVTPCFGLSHDEGPRVPDLAKIRSLKPLRDGGRITAALASQISDGAAGVLVASERAINDHGLRPRARIHQMTVRGDDPVAMLTAPIEATRLALRRVGLTLDDIDRVEINEAFASVPIAWQRELEADPNRMNVNGGAIALGHPLGASGVRLMATLVNELERSGGRYGLQTMCEAGGTANVTIIERLS